jgi:hypothetical protein
MFELGRELKRLFAAEGPKDGLTGGDASLLELLDLSMLRAEARAADIAAGRISAKDRPQRQLDAAVVWREIARRTGDAAALRKAASGAEAAAKGFGQTERPKAWARARCEQASAALLAADLFGDEGLRAAAAHAMTEASKVAGSGGLGGAMIAFGQARLQADLLRDAGDREPILSLADALDRLAAELDAHGRKRPFVRLLVAEARIRRADLLAAAGARFKDAMLSRMAIDGFTRALAGLLEVLERLNRDDSPLDWARAQLGLAAVLQMLGEATESERAFDQALCCHRRAQMVLKDQTALLERADAAYQGAVCLARRAELFGDLEGLNEAENALRAELATFRPGVDPVGWAVRQLNFARLYEARAAIAGHDRVKRAAVAEALSMALDVFGEYGHRSLADTAARSLERLCVDAPARL